MIIISYSNFFVIYLSYFLIIILIAALYNKLRHSRKITLIAENRLVFSCPVCAYRYVIAATDKIHRCPQCQSLNKKS